MSGNQIICRPETRLHEYRADEVASRWNPPDWHTWMQSGAGCDGTGCIPVIGGGVGEGDGGQEGLAPDQ